MDHIYGNNLSCEYLILSHISHIWKISNILPLGPFILLSINTRN